MSALLLFTLQALLIFAGVIALAIVLRRRLPAHWRAWVWGALAFVVSQAVRLPLLISLTLISQALRWDFGQEGNFWSNVIILSLTAGLFEETARYAVLRFLAKDVRGWQDAVMFGAGHGGIEAVLLVGIGAGVTNAYLLLNADTLLAQVRALSPEQAGALEAQLAALRNVNVGVIAASLIERVFAITLHIGLSVMVMRAVEDNRFEWVLAAMGIHALANLLAVTAQRFGGVVVAEVIVGVIALAMLAFTLHQRPGRSACI